MPSITTSTSLASLAIPDEVRGFSRHAFVDISRKVDHLPYPLNTATLWIGCNQSWPHSDPDFEGLMFINLAIEADHIYSQIMPDNEHLQHPVEPGRLFLTNPLALHWLQPSDMQLNRMKDGEISGITGYIGLQWEVSHLEAGSKFQKLAVELRQAGFIITSEHLDMDVKASLEEPVEDYDGLPPDTGMPTAYVIRA